VKTRLDVLNSRVDVLDLAVERLAGIFGGNGRSDGTESFEQIEKEEAVPACRP